MISPTAESLITFCLLDSSTNCHKTSTASSAALKHKQNIMSSFKLLFTSGLLCGSNSSVILAILYLFSFSSAAEMDRWQMETTTALLLSCGISTTGILPAHTYPVFPNAYSGTDTLFSTFLGGKTTQKWLMWGWYYNMGVAHMHASPFPGFFRTRVWQEAINHHHSLPSASHRRTEPAWSINTPQKQTLMSNWQTRWHILMLIYDARALFLT